MKNDPIIERNGDRRAYSLEPKPLGEGGQGVVFKATHKPTGIAVAFKKRKSGDGESVARMGREIEVGTHLRHRNVMPILDADPDAAWFVMPFAMGNALSRQAKLAADEERLLRLVMAVTAALGAAHDEDWIHRDVKPENVLLLPTRNGRLRWVLADWGLGRRPHGTTSVPGRTAVGVAYGTAGFAAPELGVDAHAVKATADIYSVGQLIGWATTGRLPQPNVPLLPTGGQWRSIVRDCTRRNPEDRPQSVADLVALIEAEFEEPPLSPGEQGEAFLAEAKRGDTTATVRLIKLAEAHRDDVGLYLDVIAQLPDAAVRDAVRLAPAPLLDVLQAFREHRESEWGDRRYKYADTVMGFMFLVARASATHADLELLDEAARSLFAWDDHWNQYAPQDQVKRWLPKLPEEPSRIIAAALRPYPDAARHLHEVADNPAVNVRVRQVIRAALARPA